MGWGGGGGGGVVVVFFFFKQKTAYEIVSRDWSSDVCSSDLLRALAKHIDDPPGLGRLADNVLKSPDLVRLEDEGRSPVYTTRDYQSAQNRLQAADRKSVV